MEGAGQDDLGASLGSGLPLPHSHSCGWAAAYRVLMELPASPFRMEWGPPSSFCSPSRRAPVNGAHLRTQSAHGPASWAWPPLQRQRPSLAEARTWPRLLCEQGVVPAPNCRTLTRLLAWTPLHTHPFSRSLLTCLHQKLWWGCCRGREPGRAPGAEPLQGLPPADLGRTL